MHRTPAAIVAALAFSNAAIAQTGAPPAPPPSDAAADDGFTPPPPGATPRQTLWGDFNFTLSADATFHLQSDFDDGDGDLAIARVGTGLGVSGPIGDNLQLGIGFGAEFSFYDFNDATSLTADGDPFDGTFQYDLDLSLRGQIDPRWGWFAAGGVTWAAESGANTSDLIRWRGLGGVTYSFSDDLTVGLGVGVFTRLEESELIVPIPTVRWRIDERSSLSTGGNGGIGGVGVRYTYKPTQQWTLFAQGGFNSREYRLDDDGPIPEGVAGDDRIELAIGAEYRATPNFEVHARVGVDIYSEIELLDRTGAEVAEEELDPTLVLGVGASIRF